MKKRDGPRRDKLTVSIDPYRLDEEWAEHPDRMQHVGDLLADANDLVDRLKSKLEYVKADVELRARKRPAAFGIDKATDKAVEAAVVTDDEYQAAVRRLNKAKHAAAKLKALYEARKDVRPALENLVKLMLTGYYSDPKGPAGAGRTEAMRLVAKDITEAELPRRRKKNGRQA